MIRTVQCSSCSTSFPVDPRKVPDDGVYARCSACEAVFFVEGGVTEEPVAAVTTPADDGGTTTAAPQRDVEEAGIDKPSLAEPDVDKPSFDEADFDKPSFDEPDFDKPSFDEPAPEEPAPEEPAFPKPDFDKPDFAADDMSATGSGPEAGSTTVDQPDDWVFETEPEIDPSTLQVQPLDSIEDDVAAPPPPELPAPASRTSPPPAPEPVAPPPPPPAPIPTPEPPQVQPAAAAPTPAQAFTFGKRDPHEKASRLARVLVSDIITYNPERHQRALDSGTLKADFEDEIQKSWGEYVDQVGKDLAETTGYFNDALNEILARGQQVF